LPSGAADRLGVSRSRRLRFHHVQPSGSERAAARNEALWREVNDRIEEIDEGLRVLPDDLLELHCECGSADCDTRISITPDEYREVRSQRDTFALALGHEDEVIEHVVKRTERYLVVDKAALVEHEVGADGLPDSGA
jgi:hypothetical protein